MFPVLLDRFKHIHNGGPVDKALVIRDCDRKAVEDVRLEMERKLGDRTYPFPVELCVVRRCLDSWLLADHDAISAVAIGRGGRRVGPVNQNPEEIQNAKERLMGLMAEARLPYTPAALGEISAIINLELLHYRCPSFRDFQTRVNEGL